MKNIIVIIAVVSMYSCELKNTPVRKCSVSIHNGTGWNLGISQVECDSFQMIGTKKCFVYIDGTKMNVESNNVIYPTVK